MFGPAKHKKYADIVTFQSPSAADKAAVQLHSEFHEAETRSKQVRVKRVTVLAANRAEASLGRTDLKPATRTRMRKVSKEYRDVAASMPIPPKKK
jgi:hypothetical protein